MIPGGEKPGAGTKTRLWNHQNKKGGRAGRHERGPDQICEKGYRLEPLKLKRNQQKKKKKGTKGGTFEKKVPDSQGTEKKMLVDEKKGTRQRFLGTDGWGGRGG